MAKLGKQKKAYEDSIRDRDDVYFEVQEREEQRRKQGLPSLIGVLRAYHPSVSTPEEDSESSIAPTSDAVQSRRRIKSTSRNLHKNVTSSKTRSKGASGSA
jgi:hypothetical protein